MLTPKAFKSVSEKIGSYEGSITTYNRVIFPSSEIEGDSENSVLDWPVHIP